MTKGFLKSISLGLSLSLMSFYSIGETNTVEDNQVPKEVFNKIIKYCDNYKKHAPNNLLAYHCVDAQMAGYVEFTTVWMELSAQSTKAKNVMVACTKEFTVPEYNIPEYSYVLRCMQANLAGKNIELDNPIKKQIAPTKAPTDLYSK